MMDVNIWVVPYGKIWAVKFENAKTTLFQSPSQSDAETYALNLASTMQCGLIIQDRNGNIIQNGSYGGAQAHQG